MGSVSNGAAINDQFSEGMAGFWQDLYKGLYGHVRGGLQYDASAVSRLMALAAPLQPPTTSS